MKIVTVSEMQAIEQAADAAGLSYAEMMENAGQNLAEVVVETYDYLRPEGVLGLVGRGNNGGDTLVALAILLREGWRAAACLVGARQENDPLVKRFLEAGGHLIPAGEDSWEPLLAAVPEYGLILDGILGTGMKLPLREEAAQALAALQRLLDEGNATPEIVAVDCPSGVDCDTGAAAPETLPAHLTVTMAAAKTGLFAFPAFDYVGDLEVVGIGLPDDLAPWAAVTRQVATVGMVEATIPPRPLHAHKGTFGTALVVAGSSNYTGAVLLAGKAAYRVGAGLVTCAVPAVLHLALAGHFPEATWLLLPHELGVIDGNAAELVREGAKRATAVLIGPGLGLEDPTREFLARLLSPALAAARTGIGFIPSKSLARGEKGFGDLPGLVVDADGLKLLAQLPGWAGLLPAPAVLTPHPGEMAVLTGIAKEEIQTSRVVVAERFAREWGHVVVLKGAFTVVAAPDGRTVVIPVATPALARAGTGDVLAGLIAGLRAQGVAAYEAAVAGAWLHAQAGLHAEETLGTSAAVLAGDVLAAVAEVLSEL